MCRIAIALPLSDAPHRFPHSCVMSALAVTLLFSLQLPPLRPQADQRSHPKALFPMKWTFFLVSHPAQTATKQKHYHIPQQAFSRDETGIFSHKSGFFIKTPHPFRLPSALILSTLHPHLAQPPSPSCQSFILILFALHPHLIYPSSLSCSPSINRRQMEAIAPALPNHTYCSAKGMVLHGKTIPFTR